MQEELFHTRDLSYSAWHRRRSVARYIGLEQAQLFSMCDVGCILWLEFDHYDKRPFAMIKTAFDVGQQRKPVTAICNLATRVLLPYYLRSLAERASDQNSKC